jgi:hypothetical protein
MRWRSATGFDSQTRKPLRFPELLLVGTADAAVMVSVLWVRLAWPRTVLVMRLPVLRGVEVAREALG